MSLEQVFVAPDSDWNELAAHVDPLLDRQFGLQVAMKSRPRLPVSNRSLGDGTIPIPQLRLAN